MAEQKLSDRLIKSAEKLFERHSKITYVTKFLMTGSGSDDPKSVALRVAKDAKDFIDPWIQVFKLGLKKSENQMEREFFEKCIQGLPQMFEKWIVK